jgi:hypothetical protein
MFLQKLVQNDRNDISAMMPFAIVSLFVFSLLNAEVAVARFVQEGPVLIGNGILAH